MNTRKVGRTRLAKLRKDSLWLASYESSNFTFEGVGYSEQQARVTLNAVIDQHCRNTGAHKADFFFADDVYVREILPGSGWVDGDSCLQHNVVRIA